MFSKITKIIIGTVVLLSFIPSSKAHAAKHPNMFINASEIAAKKTKVDAGEEPWKSAYDDLMGRANTAYNRSYDSLPTLMSQNDTPSGWDNHYYYASYDYGGNNSYGIVMDLGKSTRDLGLAYVFSGQNKYADKLIDYIKKWTLDSSYRMYPAIHSIAAVEEQINETGAQITAMYYGADLIWNYWGTKDINSRTKFVNEWVAPYTNVVKGKDLCRSTYCQNKELWRQLLIASGAVISEENTTLNSAFDRYKQLLDPNYKSGIIAANGCMTNEIERTTALAYSTYAMKAITGLAEIARHNGVDLYTYKNSVGTSIETAFNKYATYGKASDPVATWKNSCDCKNRSGETKCNQSSSVSEDVFALYEVAYNWKQNALYKDVIDRWSRPIYDVRAIGPVTLTHAYGASDVVSTTSTPTPTCAPVPSCSISGEAAPIGDLTDWKQIFTDDFATNVPLGNFPNAVKDKWWAYPDGWKDTKEQAHPGYGGIYYPSKVVSIKDCAMNLYIHTEDGKHMVSAPVPQLYGEIDNKNKGQLYGRYAIRFKADPISDYKTAWLLWPDSNDWPEDGEIDFPEGNLNNKICAFMHRQNGTNGGDQDAFCTQTTYESWHTAITEWSPGATKFILDGNIIGTSTSRIPNTPMHWVIQTETALNGQPTDSNIKGNVQIDWVTAYSWSPGTTPTTDPTCNTPSSPTPTDKTATPTPTPRPPYSPNIDPLLFFIPVIILFIAMIFL